MNLPLASLRNRLMVAYPDGFTLAPSTTVRNFGVIFDQDMSFNSNSKQILRTALFSTFVTWQKSDTSCHKNTLVCDFSFFPFSFSSTWHRLEWHMVVSLPFKLCGTNVSEGIGPFCLCSYKGEYISRHSP